MSLYEVTSMIAEINRRHKKDKKTMTPEKFEALLNSAKKYDWAKVN